MDDGVKVHSGDGVARPGCAESLKRELQHSRSVFQVFEVQR
jgi:hypothetical protein